MICPKCGFSQPDDYYCANCGVNVDKYVQKKKKGRYNLGLTIALIAIAALAIAKFTIPKKGSQQPEITQEKQQKVATTKPFEEIPRGRELASGTSESNELGRSPLNKPREETPDFERFAKKRVREREATPRSPLEEAPKKVEPQSEPNKSNFTAGELFEKGVSLDDDSDREIAFYQQAIEQDPKFAPAYYRLGAIYFRRADYDLAAEHFVRFLMNASEQEKQTYNTELYFSPEDLEVIREAIEESGSEEAKEEITPESEEVESAEAGEEVSTETSEEVQSLIRFSSSNGHMVVDVLLNGLNNSSMLFDTGAGITVISKELAQSLGLAVKAGQPIKLRTVAAEVQAQMAILDSITVGTFTRTDFPVAVVDLALADKKRFEGILGMDFLGNYTIRIDNQARRIFLTPRRTSSQ